MPLVPDKSQLNDCCQPTVHQLFVFNLVRREMFGVRKIAHLFRKDSLPVFINQVINEVKDNRSRVSTSWPYGKFGDFKEISHLYCK